MGQRRIIGSIPKTQTTSDLRLPGPTHTHTHKVTRKWTKGHQKNTNFHTFKRVMVSCCSWVRQLYPVLAPCPIPVAPTDRWDHHLPVVASAIKELQFIYNRGISSSDKQIYTHINVCMYVCMYVCTYVSSIYLSYYLSIYLSIYLTIYLSIYLSIYLCMYVCTYVCMHISP